SRLTCVSHRISFSSRLRVRLFDGLMRRRGIPLKIAVIPNGVVPVARTKIVGKATLTSCGLAVSSLDDRLTLQLASGTPVPCRKRMVLSDQTCLRAFEI